jgi:Na+/proline symporter
MAKNLLNTSQDKTADFLLAVGVGFLINLILGAALPQVGPFIAGLVAGVIVKTGSIRGAAAGFLAGTLGELASIALWVLTNLISFPGALLPYTWETAFAIITAVSAIMALSGGIIGSVVSLQQWPRIHEFLLRHNLSLPFLHHTGRVKLERED